MNYKKSTRAQEHKSIRAKEQRHKGAKVQRTEHRTPNSELRASIHALMPCALLTCALLTCALVLAGCTQPTAEKFKIPTEGLVVQDVNKAEAMQIAEDILAKMHFTIEKADYENGIIRTRPLPGAQFFEFWRSDNVGAFNSAEANLHSIRRIVELHISQQDTRLSIDCDVQAQRLNLPVSRESGKRLSSQRLGRLTRITGATWTDLGKDARLATEILKRICSRLDAGGSSLDIENRVSGIE